MDTEPKFTRWLELPEAEPVKFGDLPGLIAGALHSDGFAQAGAEINLESELRGLVDSGELMVRDPLTLGRHTFPIGAALRRGVLLPREDLRPLLEKRGIGLRLTRYGTGPNLWTIENAAAAIAEQEGWHQGARDTLRLQMMQAAHNGALTVRHPHTALAYRPDTVRDFYELVTPADVNAWLARDPGATLRWSQGANEPVPTAADSADSTAATPTTASQAAAKEAREDSRLAHCEAEGIVFDKSALLRLPDGIAKAAASLNPKITRQSLSTDVKAALRRRFERVRRGRP
jgi:hypothetical protein